MKKPILYNLSPAKGQALLNFQGRLYPDKVELFETEVIEEVRTKDKPSQLKIEKKDKQKQLNSDFQNLLIHGDCLSACAYLKSRNIKVDLVYIDPPFASGANYAKKIYLRNGSKETITSEDVAIGEEIMYGDIWQKEDYLNWMYERLLAIKEVMSEEASIYVHLDWHIGHYVKILLDEIFGEFYFRNEIIWSNESSSGFKSQANKYIRGHDTIFYYSNAPEPYFNKQYLQRYSEATIRRYDKIDKNGRRYKIYFENNEERWEYLDEKKGIPLVDVWTDIPSYQTVNAQRDYVYDTQKPDELLERIIHASSDKNMIVADFFVGSGTTAKVANDFNRKFIACDIGINAVQTTRDRLVKANASFDILKVKDGLRLFRNPAQTTARIYSLIDGFKTRKDLDLGDFWDGGIPDKKGEYSPVKFIGIHEKLTKQLLDVILEEIYQLQDVSSKINAVKIVYAHKDSDIDQSYINQQKRKAGKTDLPVDLINLDELLTQKADSLFMPDNAVIEVKKEDKGYTVKIKKYFSPYLKTKIDEYNSKKVKKDLLGEDNKPKPYKKVTISDSGLELIESVQFDTTLKPNKWISNLDLEDKAGVKDKIKGIYSVPFNKFKIKIRNIAGDEIIYSSDNLVK